MRILDKVRDERINATNVLFTLTIEEYINLAKEIIDKNELQRRRVKSSGTVYSLLKKDLKIGCVIPPIVLAVSDSSEVPLPIDEDSIEQLIFHNKSPIVILDGLQRSYTIRDLVEELERAEDHNELKQVLAHTLRIELYLGLNKLGILYRMLTLNTGQTPMSMRHQIEILYSDYLKNSKLAGIKFHREADDSKPTEIGDYKFRDIVDGFNSFLNNDYLTLERLDILKNIESLEQLSRINENVDLFDSYVSTYNHFANLIKQKAGEWSFDKEGFNGQPFANSVDQIFIKSQVMTGFGAAIAKLIEYEAIKDMEEIKSISIQIDYKDIDVALNELIIKLEDVRTKASKIGNDQRLFFYLFFKKLFDKESEAYQNIILSVDLAHKGYLRETQ